MFNIVIDSDKSFNVTDGIGQRKYGYDWGTLYEGEYKMGIAILTHTHTNVAHVTDNNFMTVHVNLGQTICNYQAIAENSAKSSDLVGLVVISGNRYKSIDTFIQNKVKISPISTEITVTLKKPDGTPVDIDFKYKMVLTFKKCSCKD